MQRHRERQRQRTCSTTHDQPAVDGSEERTDPSVFGTGNELHVERDRALDAFDLAQHDARRVATEVVPQFIRIQRHRLGHLGPDPCLFEPSSRAPWSLRGSVESARLVRPR